VVIVLFWSLMIFSFLFFSQVLMDSRSSPWLAKLKKLDLYTKTNDAVYKRHSLGGIFAVLVFILMFVLFVSEFSEWLQPRYKDTLSVDVVRNEKLTISFDITFHRLICDDVTIDLLDESGAHFTSTGHHVQKMALDERGNVLHTYIQERLSDAGDVASFLQQPGYCHDCLKEIPQESHELYIQLRKVGAAPACCNTCPLLVMTFQQLKLNSNLALTKLPCKPFGSAKVQNEGLSKFCRFFFSSLIFWNKSRVSSRGVH
jgi:hypothetical protein